MALSFNTSPKMLLNERFQLLRQNSQRRAQQNYSSPKTRPNAIQLRQGSAKNRRLALQMANRPAVMAALRTNTGVKQRLGLNRNPPVAGLRANPRANARLSGRLNGRRWAATRVANNYNANNAMITPFNRNALIRANQMTPFVKPFANRNPNRNQNRGQNIGVIVGLRQPVFKAWKSKARFRAAQTLKMSGSARVGAKQRKRVIGRQLQALPNNFQAKKLRINRNFSARHNTVGNASAPKKRRNVKPSRQQLDNELDAYMAGTKGYLDAEIDEYMSHAS